MSKIERKKFFGNIISDYNGELNEQHGGLSYIKNHLVHIDKFENNEAHGFYLGRTGKRIPFFALKDGDKVGVGCSYGHAADALLHEQIDDIPEEQRISEFLATHKKDELTTIEDIWKWHRYLTGSCYGGGLRYIEEYGFKMDDPISIQRFILLTEKVFGDNFMSKLKPYYFDDGDTRRFEDIPV